MSEQQIITVGEPKEVYQIKPIDLPTECPETSPMANTEVNVKKTIDILVRAAFVRKYRRLPTKDTKFGMSKKHVKQGQQLVIYHKKTSGQLLKIGVIEITTIENIANFKLLENEKDK